MPSRSQSFRKALDGNILRDDLIVLTNPAVQSGLSSRTAPLTALVEVDGQLREMVFPDQQPDVERPDHR